MEEDLGNRNNEWIKLWARKINERGKVEKAKTLIFLREGFNNKKLVEFSTKRGGRSAKKKTWA